MNQTSHSNPQRIRDIVDDNELVYASRVLWLLREMAMDEIKPLYTTNSNYQRFVNVVKSLIDLKLPEQFGFSVEFNPDYTKLKKIEL
jgi:hypothetical protein